MSRWGSPSRLTGRARLTLESDPWPGLPLLEAVTQVAKGDLAVAGRALRRLDLDHLPRTHDLEMLTFAVETVAAAGTDGQRMRMYELLAPHAGVHIVVGGCASYFGAVDHCLGLLTRSLGNAEQARGHFEAAAGLHDRLGAPAMAHRSRTEATACHSRPDESTGVFRRYEDVWTISYGGTEAHLPDSKGLRDLAALLAQPGHPSTLSSCKPVSLRRPAPTTFSTTGQGGLSPAAH